MRHLVPCLMGICAFTTIAFGGQFTSLTVERQKWLTQFGATTIPLLYYFEAEATGIGIQSAELASPATVVPLDGSTILRSYSTSLTAIAITGTNIIGGLTNFNASFPAGSYRLTGVTSTTNPITHAVTYATNQLTAAVTNDFPAIEPLITSPTSWTPVSASQVFTWPVFTTQSDGSFVSFYVLQGQFDTNTLNAIATNGVAYLTNFELVANYPRLSPAENTVTLTNLNTHLDHLALLQFHAASQQASQLAIVQGNSVSSGLFLYPDSLSYLTNELVLAINQISNLVAVSWSTNGTASALLAAAADLYALSPAPPPPGPGIRSDRPGILWSRLTNRPAINAQGRYEVLLPAELPRRFFRLEGD